MDFCIITPAAGLERYATLSKTHLVLAQVKNEQYGEFYRRKSREGDFIILDNGAYEGVKSFDTYQQSIDFYEPSVVILPDFLHQHWERTYEASKDFLDRFYEHYPMVKWMYVPQTEDDDLMGWIEGALHAINELPVDWIGLPRVMQTHYFPNTPNVRAKACKFIEGYDNRIKLHALGMVKGSVEELDSLAAAGCNSIDSSAPVWRGWCGYDLENPEDHMLWDKIGVECDFDTKSNGREEIRILHNLEAVHVDVSRAR